MLRSLVGSEMCIRDSTKGCPDAADTPSRRSNAPPSRLSNRSRESQRAAPRDQLGYSGISSQFSRVPARTPPWRGSSAPDQVWDNAFKPLCRSCKPYWGLPRSSRLQDLKGKRWLMHTRWQRATAQGRAVSYGNGILVTNHQDLYRTQPGC
eukprot:TRINITY_DN1493_c0_g1_i1.p2 TRINITY_DN1493_c0_g1~~TRINITY_DN1493_c0_g1_i1.p2  ORF type:complete len:151 (+),score=27.91 TRINITY_DN1493_c0_g1_i1:159-611(+)